MGAGDGGVLLEDAGSSYGTWLDGRRLEGRQPLRDGSRIRMGNQELVVERRRDEAEAGRTVVVPRESRSWSPPGAGASVAPATGRFGTHPKVRSGYALKRLEASEGERRWVLRDLESNRFLRDVRRRRQALRAAGRPALAGRARPRGRAERRREGPARLARLLSELADRGLLAGVAGRGGGGAGARARATARGPEREDLGRRGRLFDRLYRHGGWRLFTRPALAAIAALGVAGLACSRIS